MAERLQQQVTAVKRELETETETETETATPTTVPAAGVEAEEAASAPKRARFDESTTTKTDERGRNKWERRDRRGTGAVSSTSTDNAAESASASSSSERLPKRKVAVKFGYCGIGYSGLQINPGVKTIEGDIFKAFCTAGAVSKHNALNPNKVGLQRAARTDRGVHAAGNLLSLKLILQPQGLAKRETLVDKVNGLLPEFIRIWAITRVQNGFNARQSCDSRMYEYLLPTYVFLPPKPRSTMHEMLKRMRQDELTKLRQTHPDANTTTLDSVLDHPFWASHGTTHDFATDMAAKKQYRLPASALERVRSIFARFLGSHNFYNFTVGKQFRDRSCQRFMNKLSISEPKLIHDVEWVSIKLHGQSFMLHQIRKMIGLLVLVARSGAGEGLVEECFGPARVHIPKAPGLGLLLERPIFDAYNLRIRNNNEKIHSLIRKKGAQSEGLRDELREGVSYTDHEARMESFKQQWIYDRITATEHETHEFGKWLNYLDVFQGPDFEYLNPKGVIVDKAIVKVGEFHRDQLKSKSKPSSSSSSSSNNNNNNNTTTTTHNVQLPTNAEEHHNSDLEEDHEAYSKSAQELDEYEG